MSGWPRWVIVLAIGAMVVGLIVVIIRQRLTEREYQLINESLVCFDCSGEMDSVRALAARKPVVTVDTLRHSLVHGPGAPQIAAAESVFAIAYVRDSSYRDHHLLPPLSLNRADYVLSNRKRYDAGYRSQGAVALGWIHDARAVAALDSALTIQLPSSVGEAVQYALDSLPRR